MENKTAMPVMNKKTFKFQLFPLLNGLGFALFCFLIIIPLWRCWWTPSTWPAATA